MGTPRLARAVGTLALVAIALVFSGVLDNGFVNWDDYIYVHHNPLVTDPSSATLVERLTTPRLGYPLPLPVFIHGALWTDAAVAWPFHLVSLLVHLINVGLLGHLLRQTRVPQTVAAVAMFAFACHPLVVEPVAWVTALKDLLVASGMLLALLGSRRGWSAVPGALLAFASKPTSVLLALPLAAAAWVDDAGQSSAGRRWAAVGAVAVLGAALAVFTAGQESEVLRTTLDRPFSLTRALGALGLQLQHTLAPATLAPRYDPSQVGAVSIALGGVTLVGVTASAVRWVTARDPRLPWLALGVAAYLPVSNLQPLERFTADSYAYVPWMSVVACLAITWTREAQRLRARVRKLLRGLVMAACLLWPALTWVQVEAWSNSLELWRDLYVTQPGNPEAIYFYGDGLGRAGEVDAELALYLTHEADLERGSRVPVLLPVYHDRAGDPDRALFWYTRAFQSPIRQAEGVYWNYIDFVSDHPRRHPELLDDALRYALLDVQRQGRLDAMPAARRRNLAAHATRLGLHDLAQTLRSPAD